jgi:hypothetical protein
MNFSYLAAPAALAFALVTGQAQAVPVVGGKTTVNLTSAAALTGLGVTVTTLGSATAMAGAGGIPVVDFPITGGDLSSSFAGTIEHIGSGLKLTAGTASISLTDFLINTSTLSLSGGVQFGTTTLANVPLLNLVSTGNAAAPFDLTLTTAAAGALNTVFGSSLASNFVLATASTAPTFAPAAAIPEPSTYASLAAGLGIVALALRRRKHLAHEVS